MVCFEGWSARRTVQYNVSSFVQLCTAVSKSFLHGIACIANTLHLLMFYTRDEAGREKFTRDLTMSNSWDLYVAVDIIAPHLLPIEARLMPGE